MKKSEQLFEALYNRLVELGRHGQAQALVDYRSAVQSEAADDAIKVAADVRESLQPKVRDFGPLPVPEQHEILQAGAPAGEQALVASAGQAGLPAESEQPATAIP